MEHHEFVALSRANRAKLRELADAISRTADAIADTFERAAELHEAIAGEPSHPLFDGAAESAVRERAWAEHERDEGRRFRAV